MICLGWVLWHINHCRLFNAKSSLYIYIKYIYFAWVGFYAISTIVSYLISDIYDLLTHFVDNISEWAWANFICIQLNGFKYCNITAIFIYLHTQFVGIFNFKWVWICMAIIFSVKWLPLLLSNTNNSIWY